MANKIQFKRGEGAPAVGVLDVGEPGFDLTNKKLYIGTGIAESPILINKDFPSDYGYGGKAVALHSARINTEEELTTKLEELYGAMKEKETKLIYWGGYPAGTTEQTWFGILTKSSTANGSVLAWSAYNSGELIRKVKFDSEWKAVIRYTTTDDLTLDKLGAAPAGYGYGGNAININIGDRVNNEDELTTALSVVYDQMIAPETKLVYWNGYPAAKDSTHGWFGILTKSSDRNGGIIAWSTYNEGSLIRKSKYSGSWQPLEWENPPMTAGEEYRTTERINGKIVFKMADDAGNVWYAFDDDGPWRSYSDLVGSNSIRNLVEELTIAGGIGSDKSEAGLGVDMNTDGPKASYVRTEPIPVMKGDVIKASNLNGAENYSLYLLYDSQMNLIDHLPGTKNADYHSVQKTVQQDGYVRFCQRKNALSTVKIELHEQVKGNLLPRKTLNILVIGNSFSQDSFAYLPPVLNEILHDYSITYGVAYSAGTELPEQVKWKINKEITEEEAAEGASIYYNFFNYWEPGATKWTRETKKTIEDVVARKKWDIIYLQPGGAQKNDGEIRTNIINPGRTILNWLQERNGGPFSLMMGNHLAVSDTSFANLCNGMVRAKQWLGICDFIPIGTAIQNARTNAEWAKLEGQGIGTAGAKTAPIKDKEGNITGYKTPHPLLYKDCTHMQAGIPALIATYTIALKILEVVGESGRGIYDSSFVPTKENCVAIGAGSESGGTKMTHGDPRGVTAENIKLAQEYAVLAVNNPTQVSNGSNLPVATPSFGYGEPMHWLGFDPGEGKTTGKFQTDLEAAFTSLPQGGSMQVQFVDTNLNGQKHMGTLWKYTSAYGFLESTNYSGVRAIKTYYGSTWNDWEYLPNLNCVTPQMFGAKGDGETDDTAAFQAALDTGRTVYIPAGKRYRITGTLNVETVYQNIHGDNARGSKTAGSTIYFDPKEENGVLFVIKDHDIYFNDISIIGKDKGTVFQCKARLEERKKEDGTKEKYYDIDQDIDFVNVRVYSVKTVFDFEGRGIKVMNCSFGSLHTIFVGNWDKYLTEIPFKDTNDRDEPHKTGQRGYVFQNNRLHSIRQRFIKIESGHAYGLVFENNVIDHGRGLVFDVADEAWNWVVTGNVMQDMIISHNDMTDSEDKELPDEVKPATFNFSGGAKNCIFTNNVLSSIDKFWGSTDIGVTPSYYMKFASLTNSVILGNSLDNCTNDAIVIKGTAANSVISGNTFTNIDGEHISIGNSAEFEWDNPPMELGVEYRTTERYLGKPVYVKLIDLGNLKNAGETEKIYCGSGANCVKFEVTAVDSVGHLRMLPFITTSGELRTTMRCTQYKVIVKTFSDLSGYTAKAKVWYTKN